ncbi:adenine modification methytransferase [Paraburkholderia caffeinilytica]|uniref:adenine modification methytransferase n=1 Tax=Paraburkholderia caffeinilytica TaxID=1761016 RepID=UPI003D9FE33C
MELEEYERLAAWMSLCWGKVMVSLNDHPDMRRVFAAHSMLSVDVHYDIGSRHGQAQGACELVIANWLIGTATAGLL